MALSANLNFFFAFAKSGAGVTGKSGSITVTVKKLTRGSSPTITTVTTGGAITVGSVTEVDGTNAKGLYVLGVSGLDPTADYLASAHYTGTSTDVDNVDVPALQTEFSSAINGGAVPQVTAGSSSGGLPTLDANGDISAKWGAAAQAMALEITRGIKGTVWIVDPVNGNDANAGTWASPFATPLPTRSGGPHPASAGDLILICGGVCSLGSSQYAMVAGTTLAGMGKEASIITGSGNGFEIVKVASDCVVRDLTVKSTLTPAVSKFNYPIGANLTTVTNVLIQRVAGYADTDIFYFTGAGSTVTIEDCTPHSNWDCLFASGAGTYVQVVRTPIFTTASNAASPTSNSSVQAADGAFVRLIDCPIVNFNTNTNVSRQTHVVHTGNTGTAGARIELVRSPILMAVDGSTQQTILADTGTTVVLENSPYDFTKTSGAGTITEQTNKSGVDFNNLAQAASATTLNNLTVPTVTNLANLPAIPANWLTAAGISAGALNGKGDWLLASSYVVPDNTDAAAAASGVTTLLTRITGTIAAQTGDSYARLGAPAGASVSADVAAVKGDTGNLISRLGAWTGSGVNTVLGAFRALANKMAGLTPTDLTSGGGTFDNTTDSTEAIADSSGNPADAVLNASASSYDTPGTIGAKINAAGALGDPLANDVPGSYGPGTAGHVLGQFTFDAADNVYANARVGVPTLGGNVPTSQSPALSGQTITSALNYPFAQSIIVSNTNLTNWSKVVFTVKLNATDTDANAKLTIQVSNPPAGGDGITVLNGGSPVSASDGSITVTATTTEFTAAVNTIDRGMFSPFGKYVWEMAVYAGGVKQAWLGSGPFILQQTVVAALT